MPSAQHSSRRRLGLDWADTVNAQIAMSADPANVSP